MEKAKDQFSDEEYKTLTADAEKIRAIEEQIAALAPAEDAASSAAAQGTAFPKFEGSDLEGNPVDNSLFAGNAFTVVNFWFNGCKPCVEEMGSQLAERFGASQISSTAKIVEVDTTAHTITAERDLERGTEVLRAKYPCLLTVEKANFRLRIPNLKRWKASRTADIAVYSAATIPGLDPAQIGDPGSPTKVPRTYPPEVGAKGSMIDEGSTEKNVDRLFGLIADVL